MAKHDVAVIAGVGPGLSAAVCRTLAGAGYPVAGLAISAEFGNRLAGELVARGDVVQFFACDVTDENYVDTAICAIEASLGAPAVLIYNDHNTLTPEAIANCYRYLVEQARSAWTLELDLRLDVESF